MKKSDVTAKRGPTKEESESCVPKKPRVEDEEDTSMEDDTSDSSEWEVDAEDEGHVRSERVVLDMPEEEPEWDKDSYDGHQYASDPEDRKHFATDEEYECYRKYLQEAAKHRGFLPDPPRNVYPLGGLDDLCGGSLGDITNREYLANVASLCVKKLNEEKGMSVEFVSIVRCNIKAGGRWKLYITFLAREYPGGPPVEYQAKAMEFAGGKRPTFPIFCRPASSVFFSQ